MKILIVDDHLYNRELLGFILEDHGYDFVCAENGLQAVSAVRDDSEIALILMDINMPVMDGYESTRQIAAMNSDRFLPIIFVTALDNDATLARCLEVGGHDFVPKPINESVLVAKLRAHARTIDYYHQLQATNIQLSYHQRQVEREHAIVEHVFKKGMKRINIGCDNVLFHTSPMSMFNGDLLLIAPSQKGGVYVLVGDFTGHGLSAAIGSLPVTEIFYSATAQQMTVGEIAAEINVRLQDLLPSHMFFCAAIAELSPAGDKLSLWVGGMNDLLVVGPEGGVSQRIRSMHPPLGILAEREFDAEIQVVFPNLGSQLCIYTDGVVEAQRDDGEMFGEQRLQALFNQPRADYVADIIGAIQQFCEGAAQSDDIAILQLSCVPVRIHGELVANTLVKPLPEAIYPFQFTWQLGPEALKREHVISQLVNTLATQEVLQGHLDSLYTLLSDAFSNALEHGLLALDSGLKADPEGFAYYFAEREARLARLTEGEIVIQVNLQAGDPVILHLTVSDSGQGFDVAAVLAAPAVDDLTIDQSSDRSSGRGISLLQALAETVAYSDNGRTLHMTYRLDNPAASQS